MLEYDGNKLRTIRTERGITQFQLAIMLGLYPSQISRIERHKKKFSRVLALAVASVLGVDMAELRFCPPPADYQCVGAKKTGDRNAA